LRDEFNIPSRYLKTIMSPWAVKRLHEFGGDISKFRVVKVYPSILDQLAIAKTEPGDENNQDISSLVGKVDIRQLEHFSQDDADAYAYSGALCRANQGIMEFVEMFKAPIKVLHPLLTATQEGNYNGTEGLSALPYSGIILAHSNESEWSEQRSIPRQGLYCQSALLSTGIRRTADLQKAHTKFRAISSTLRPRNHRNPSAI